MNKYKTYLILLIIIFMRSNAIAYDFIVNNVYYTITSETEVCVSNNDLGEYDINKSYSGNLIIPSSVTYGEKTYTVTAIGDKAFWGCQLTGLSLPNTIRTIGDQALCAVTLTSLTIPNSVTSLGWDCIGACQNLKTVVLSNQLSEISSSCFYASLALTEITIPESVKKIADSAFGACNSLTKVELPSGLTSIGNRAFELCNLYSVVIPSSVVSIGEYVFAQNRNLNNVYTNIINPSSIHSGVFHDISSSAVLHIPKGTKNLYQKYSGWTRYFTDIVEDIDNPNYNPDPTPIVTTYTLSVSASGSGYASYGGTSIRGTTSSFTLNEGTSATISFSPDDGYRIASVKVNGSSVSTSSSVTVTMNSNTTVAVVFEEIPVVTYTMTVTAKGNGEAAYNGSSVRDGSREFTVNEGSSPRVAFSPDLGNHTKTVKLNGSEVSFSDNRYTISNVRGDNTLEVEFEELESKFSSGGINYEVSSFENMAVKIGMGDFGLSIEVPEKVINQKEEYKIEGITDETMNANKDLAAIIWNPNNAINFNNSNPNLLLYVKDAKYAPAGINNVVIGETAESIVLADAQNGNNFYCPKAFTAKKITYSHRYRMRTGGGESKGWETIALPFDVQKIEHVEEGEIVPFAKWSSSSPNKPFWLYQLSSSGFIESDGIKANTPYIISMPNNEVYRDEYILRGTVTFSASNVEVKKSDEIVKSKYGDRTFIPNFINLDNNAGYYALNVNNDVETYQGLEKEGSLFVLNLRRIHPFEAYMTSTAGSRSIGIFDDMSTYIRDVEANGENTLKVYNLNGQFIKIGTSMDELRKELPTGLYIINNKKVIVK